MKVIMNLHLMKLTLSYQMCQLYADKSSVQIIKKEAIYSKSQNVSKHAKVEPDIPEIVETYEKDNVLLSHKKLDTHGNLLMNTEKRNLCAMIKMIMRWNN